MRPKYVSWWLVGGWVEKWLSVHKSVSIFEIFLTHGHRAWQQNTFLLCFWNRNFFFLAISELENRYFFLGSENKITLSRFYNIRFLCYYSMNWYPFDLQTCSIVLKMKGKGGDFASLFTDKLLYLGRYLLTSLTTIVLEGHCKEYSLWNGVSFFITVWIQLRMFQGFKYSLFLSI